MVVGTLLVVTGLSLMKIATNVAFAANTPYFGKPAVFEMFPATVRIVAADGIVVGTLAAVVLNLALPKR